MILFLLAYLGGALTILSPCILPVLPFVFTRADRPFITSGLPLLIGMAGTFAVVATLAGLGGGWVVQANEYGRDVAVVLLAFFGVTLLFPSLSDHLTRPLVALGSRLSQSAQASGGRDAILPSVLLGVATGLLWAPCAGPILGLILTGAALHGASVQTTLLLLAYAAGAATSLALALLVGGKVFATMKKSLGIGEWIRKGLGVAVLAGVVVIALGLDTTFLTSVSLASTNDVEQSLLDRLHPAEQKPVRAAATSTPPGGSISMTMTMQQAGAPKQTASAAPPAGPSMTGPSMAGPSMAMTGKPVAPAQEKLDLPVEDEMPPLDGATQWLNSKPLDLKALKGKVVLIDFWTYSCINCLRAIPYVRAWADKYRDQGLVVIGVHSPEFPFERNVDNVKKAIADLKIDYPVAIDNNYAIWQAFQNQYWPAHYFIDAKGNIRHHHFGEGDYAESEHVIQQLLAEAGHNDVGAGVVDVKASGAEAAADTSDVKSPETYIGYNRAESFNSDPREIHDKPTVYNPAVSALNQWGLTGDWTVGGAHATLNAKDGGIVYRFHARDLHLVLGTDPKSGPVHFQVTIDGKPPGDNHGIDADADGHGVVTGERLYQLVRQNGAIGDHTFEIHFSDPGVQAYSFTFG